jgi:hypothetical protein
MLLGNLSVCFPDRSAGVKEKGSFGSGISQLFGSTRRDSWHLRRRNCMLRIVALQGDGCPDSGKPKARAACLGSNTVQGRKSFEQRQLWNLSIEATRPV